MRGPYRFKSWGERNQRIRGVRLRRNFGQHHALTAGIDHARASWYVVMDCDLQDAPEDIPLLFEKAQEGYDIVVGYRKKEGHSFVKRHSSRAFYLLFDILAGIEVDWGVGNFRIFSNNVAEGFREMREQMRFFPASLSSGFRRGKVALPHHPRLQGISSYTWRKLVSLAGNTILAHSHTPLNIAAGAGFFIAMCSFLAGLSIGASAPGLGNSGYRMGELPDHCRLYSGRRANFHNRGCWDIRR